MKQLLFFGFILLVYLGCVNEWRFNINDEISESHVHLTDGIWILQPEGYKKADSYVGYQAPKYASSISVKRIYQSIEDFASGYSDSALRFKDISLSDRRPIYYQGEEIGLLVKFFDKRTRTVQYNLAFELEDEKYTVSAFYHKDTGSKYKSFIHKCIKTLVIGEEDLSRTNSLDDKELVRAYFHIDFETVGLTRDGLNPTESEDSLVVEYRPIENRSRTEIIRYLRSEAKKVNPDIKKDYKPEINNRFQNSTIYSYDISNDVLGTIMIVSIDKQDHLDYFKITGNDKLDLSNIHKLIDKNFYTLYFD